MRTRAFRICQAAVVVGLPGEDERITAVEGGGETEPGSGHGASIVYLLQWEGIGSVGRHRQLEGYHLPIKSCRTAKRWFSQSVAIFPLFCICSSLFPRLLCRHRLSPSTDPQTLQPISAADFCPFVLIFALLPIIFKRHISSIYFTRSVIRITSCYTTHRQLRT